MAYQVTITADAERQFRQLTVREQRILESAIVSRLQQAPETPTNAIKRLRANPFVNYELRVGDLRALYNVEGTDVVLLVIGKIIGNRLLVEGKEFHAHQDDPPQPPGSESRTDAE